MLLYSTEVNPDSIMDESDENSYSANNNNDKKLVTMSNSIQLSIQPIAAKIFSLEANCFVDFEGGSNRNGGVNGGVKKKSGPPITANDAAQNGGLWSRTYSEGVRVERDGPQRQCRFKSYLQYAVERHFKETVFFERRLVPHSYCTTLLVRGHDLLGVADDAGEDADGAVQPAARLTYFEQICFKNKTVIIRRAETVYNFPREAHRRSVAKTTYHHDRKLRNYVSGIRVSAPDNRMLVVFAAPEVVDAAVAAASATNGEGVRINGYGHVAETPADIRDVDAGDDREAVTDAKTVYNSVKEIEIS